jgi:PAS domain S-box-containing protein
MSQPDQDCFQQLADGAPVMIWMSGLDMGCYYFNRAWLDFRGRTLEKEFGNGWAEGVHPEDLQRCVDHYVDCFKRRIAFAMSYRLLNFSGSYRWILDRGAPHVLPDGGFRGFFGGCAELDNDSHVSRGTDLGRHLPEIKEFALRLAATVAKKTGPGQEKIKPLDHVVRELGERRAQRAAELQRATSDMRKLATDMVSYSNIAKGACLT